MKMKMKKKKGINYIQRNISQIKMNKDTKDMSVGRATENQNTCVKSNS